MNEYNKYGHRCTHKSTRYFEHLTLKYVLNYAKFKQLLTLKNRINVKSKSNLNKINITNTWLR